MAREHRLVVGLLDLARAPVGNGEPVRVLPLVQKVLRESGQQPTLHAAPGTAALAVPTHPVWLERILANLLDNAQRHGGGAVAVTVARAGSDVVVCVDDRGPGVAEDLREAVFAGLDVSGPAPEGNRLGLPLSRRAARRAGGDLSVETRPGGGARFVLRLPLAGPS